MRNVFGDGFFNRWSFNTDGLHDWFGCISLYSIRTSSVILAVHPDNLCRALRAKFDIAASSRGGRGFSSCFLSP